MAARRTSSRASPRPLSRPRAPVQRPSAPLTGAPTSAKSRNPRRPPTAAAGGRTAHRQATWSPPRQTAPPSPGPMRPRIEPMATGRISLGNDQPRPGLTTPRHSQETVITLITGQIELITQDRALPKVLVSRRQAVLDMNRPAIHGDRERPTSLLHAVHHLEPPPRPLPDNSPPPPYTSWATCHVLSSSHREGTRSRTAPSAAGSSLEAGSSLGSPAGDWVGGGIQWRCTGLGRCRT